MSDGVPGSAVPHGTDSRYTNQRCRCAPCREAHRLSIAAARARRKTAPIPDYVVHGRASTYTNWACRCEPCAAARRVRDRNRYIKRMPRTFINPPAAP